MTRAAAGIVLSLPRHSLRSTVRMVVVSMGVLCGLSACGGAVGTSDSDGGDSAIATGESGGDDQTAFDAPVGVDGGRDSTQGVDSGPHLDSGPGPDGTLDGGADGRTEGGVVDGTVGDEGPGRPDAAHMEAGASDAADGSAGDGTADGGTVADVGACTPLTGADFFCGTVMCNGATSYCLHGYLGQMCTPMPSECQCAETHGCDCLVANANPCDAGPVTCSAVLFDGGLLFLQALNCP
jgi:hypothetical protein